MMKPSRASLPSWLPFAAAILLITPALPACAQATAGADTAAPEAHSTAPAQPATTGPSGPATNRAEAYYHDALAAIYEDAALNEGRPDDVTRAIEEYKYALNDDPDSAELQNGLADLYFRAGRVQDAQSTAEGLLKSQPDDIPANKLLGRIYLRQLGEQDMSSNTGSNEVLKKAIAQFEKIVSLEPRNVDNHMVLGQLYTVNKQPDKAEAQFKTAQAIEPDSEDVVLNLVRVYAESGNIKEAAQVIQNVPAESRTPKMEFALGAAYQQMKDSKDAIAAYQRANQMDPEDARTLSALAEALLTNNQLDEALKEYKKLAAADPEEPGPLVHIAEIQRKQGQYEDALATIKKARGIDPKDPEGGYNEALLYDILGQFDQAAHTYQQMVDLTSHANGAYTPEEKNNRSFFLDKLAGVYVEQNKIEDAVAEYQKMIDMGGDDAVRGYEQQAEAYQGAHEPDKAIEALRSGVAAHPKNTDLKLILAGSLADQGGAKNDSAEIDQAFNMVKALLTNKSSDLNIWESMAQMNIRLKRWKDAEDNLDKAEPLVTKQDDKIYLLFLRGEWAERQHHVEPAERFFRQALALDPSNAMTLNYLGYMLADKGVQLPNALQLVQQAVKQQPANGAYLDSLGWVYYKMGDYERAEDNLRSAAERDQVDPTVHMHLGDLYEKTGRIRQAAAQWQLSLDEFSKSNPADVEPGDVAKVQKKLESARVKLAKEDSQFNQPKPRE
ncbi:MAG TPA: tetratricopeptide repeat protein [Terracidiphilus sp.]|nr:tetratricopeptide repeat protein [Terracidiphilus sp.]